jgi:hypothetical protein
VDHPDLDLGDLELRERVLERLDRPGDVALDDEVEGRDVAPLDLCREVLEGLRAGLLDQLLAALTLRAALRDVAGEPLVVDDSELVPEAGDVVPSEHENGLAGRGGFDRVPGGV